MTETIGQAAKRKLLALASSDHQYGDWDYIVELIGRVSREEYRAGFNAGVDSTSADYTGEPIEDEEDE